MGMAASQARLLSLTARIHDLEYQGQAIQNAKLTLATQSDAAYKKYNEALEATTLTVVKIDGAEKSTVPATFNNLCSKSKVQAANGKEFALHDKYGRLVVSQDVASGYEKYKDTNAETFAMYMLGYNQDEENVGETQKNVANAGLSVVKERENEQLSNLYDSIVSFLQSIDSNFNPGFDINDEKNGSTIYDGRMIIDNADLSTDKKKEYTAKYDSMMLEYNKMLYSDPKNGEEIFETLTKDSDSTTKYTKEDYSYYVNIFNQIKASNGCISIEDPEFKGVFNGETANNSDWLQGMIQSGQITLSTVDYHKKTGLAEFNTTSPSEDSVISYTETTSIDKKALAKAEAEYNQTLNQINRKDKQYDLTLSKLDTERNALTKEYDQVKKVASDNIERTFGIFS